MKNVILFFLTLGTLTASADAIVKCSGQAEGGSIKIISSVISNKKITINYIVKGSALITKNYVTTEFFVRNGSTDLNKKAYMIGGTLSGRADDYDDISLPHFGNYKSGLGSEIAFNHGSERVFGTVRCVKK